MRVICVQNSILIDKNNPNCGGVIAHKGSIYTVIGTIQGEKMKEMTGINFAPGIWYEFLELPGFHHHIRFLEILEDDIEVEMETTKNGDRLYR